MDPCCASDDILAIRCPIYVILEPLCSWKRELCVYDYQIWLSASFY